MKPFRYGCVVTDDAFCPRPGLQKALEGHIRDGQNVVLTGERRTGKTSLIHETCKGMKRWRMLYADLLNIRTAADFCNRVATAAAHLGPASSLAGKALQFLSRLRPTLSLDPSSGMPVVSVDSALAADPRSMDDVMGMVGKLAAGGRTFVVFDEFQEIRRIPDWEQALAVLRSRIQMLPEVCFVFSGSVRADIVDIFTNPSSPFFKSAIALTVGPVPDDDFAPFLTERFARGRRTVARDLLDEIFDFTNRIPGDVQQFCSAVWNATEPGTVVGREDLKRALSDIFAQEGGAFEIQTERLTRFQFKALVAVARWGGKKVFSGEFIRHAEAPSAATVARALKSLVGTGLLFVHEREYRFFNPFLRAWLLERFPI